MSRGDTARVAYQAARQELLERIKLRDHVLMVYLAAVGTIFGIALGTPPELDILLAVPFIGVGVATIASQHSTFIGHLGQFCVELDKFMDTLQPSESAPQWDTSTAQGTAHAANPHRLRAFAQALLLVGPSLLALVLNFGHSVSRSHLGILWWAGAICLVASLWVIGSAYRVRRKLYVGRWSIDSASSIETSKEQHNQSVQRAQPSQCNLGAPVVDSPAVPATGEAKPEESQCNLGAPVVDSSGEEG